jgi:hypothetical protein
MVPLAAGTEQGECPAPTEGGEELACAAFRGPRIRSDRPLARRLEPSVGVDAPARQPRSATGASENAVMRCRSLTRSAISSAVSRATRSVPNSSTLYDASAVP